MTDFTPTTDLMREWYVLADHTGNKSRAEYEAEFDRWLNTIKADAIRETATLTTRRGQGFVYVKDILEYARRVARGKA